MCFQACDWSCKMFMYFHVWGRKQQYLKRFFISTMWFFFPLMHKRIPMHPVFKNWHVPTRFSIFISAMLLIYLEQSLKYWDIVVSIVVCKNDSSYKPDWNIRNWNPLIWIIKCLNSLQFFASLKVIQNRKLIMTAIANILIVVY